MTPTTSTEKPTEMPESVKAVLGVFDQLTPELHAECVSEDPSIIVLDYEPVPLSPNYPEGEAEQKYKLLLDVIDKNFNLLGSSTDGHGEHGHDSHGEHHHHESLSRMRELIRYSIEELIALPNQFSGISQELWRRVRWKVKETFAPTLSLRIEDRKTRLDHPLSPAWKERHLTKAGVSSVRDCRELTNEKGEVVYLMPASEYRSKVEGKEFPLKDKKIREKTKKWVEEMPQRADEKIAAEALRGDHMYIVPILSGLKPAAFEDCDLGISRAALETFQKISVELPDQLKILRLNPKQGSEKILIYNPSAVDEVLKKYPEAFAALDIKQGTLSDNVVDQVLLRYHLTNDRLSSAWNKAVGLLLGYDERSIDDYDKPKGETQRFKIAPHVYHFNEAPLCMWGVDYSVADPETNEEYQSRLMDYERLQKEIERALDEGKTPYEILKELRLFEQLRTTNKDLLAATQEQ